MNGLSVRKGIKITKDVENEGEKVLSTAIYIYVSKTPQSLGNNALTLHLQRRLSSDLNRKGQQQEHDTTLEDFRLNMQLHKSLQSPLVSNEEKAELMQ